MVDLVEATIGAVPSNTKAEARLDYSIDADAIRLRILALLLLGLIHVSSSRKQHNLSEHRAVLF